MAIGVRRLLGAVSVMALVGLTAQAALAQQAPATHVRAESAEFRALIQRAASDSPTVNALIDRLNRSDVVVYVRHGRLSWTLDGRTGLFAVNGSTRYLVVELACPRSALTLAATLAHELQHAVEIADSPAIVDAASLERFYTVVGERAGAPGRLLFETAAARAVGSRVRREIGSPSKPF